MAIQTLNVIKNWFKTGLKPSEAQFGDTWDSFWHKQDAIPVASVTGLDTILNGKASQELASLTVDTLAGHMAEVVLYIDFVDLAPFVYNCPEYMQLNMQETCETTSAYLNPILGTAMAKFTKLTITPTSKGLITLKGILL